MITQAGCVDLVLISDCQRDIRRAMIGLLKRSGSESTSGEVIACLGAKGGVGTTMIACNLADGLASRFPERRTILVDLNLYLGDVALQLDINPETTTLFFLERASGLEAEQLRTLPMRHPRGFQVIALDGNINHAGTISVEQVVFLLGRLRERYDFVILDCGSSLTEVSMSACSDADRRLIVVTETIASRMGARRRVSALRALDPDRRAVQAVLNRCHDRSPEALSQIEQSLGTSIIGSVSNAWSTVSASLAQGQTLLASSPRSPASTDIKHLVDSLAGKSNAAARRKKAFFNFFR
jgi:pilus assembly protein CpaE